MKVKIAAVGLAHPFEVGYSEADSLLLTTVKTLKKFGADSFKLLLNESSNRVEYQLNAILKKYDLRDDDQKVKYLQESAELISTLNSAVQREVYGTRAAEAALKQTLSWRAAAFSRL